MRRRGPTWRAVAALLLLCLLLGAAVMLERRHPEQAALRLQDGAGGANQAGGGAAGTGRDGGVYSPPGEAAFKAIDLRPLFAPDRRPPETEAAPAEAGPPLPESLDGLALTGIISAGGKRFAIVEPKGRAAPGAQNWSLRVGGELRGWTVDEIGEDRIVLVNGGVRHEMALVDDTARRGAPTQRQQPANAHRQQPRQPAPPLQPAAPSR